MFHRLQLFRSALALTIGAASQFASAQASFSPASFTGSLQVGQTIVTRNIIRTDALGATTVDVFFLADNTGSMGSTVAKAQSGASAILNALPSTYQFGVGAYFGDPSEPGMTPATSYKQLTALTSNKTAVQAGINGWIASGGGDFPEANYFALSSVANTAAWRPEAQRLVVWLGDAPSHTETTTQAQAIGALRDAGAKVVAFNNVAAGGGIDGFYSTEANTVRQATDIVNAVGGSVTQSFLNVSNAQFINAVTSLIASAASTVNLSFFSSLASSGLSLAFTCTDALGCNNVPGGQSRSFDLAITGVTPGTYDFNIRAQGVDAFQRNLITVTAVPEPASYALMLLGMLAVGSAALRRGRAG